MAKLTLFFLVLAVVLTVLSAQDEKNPNGRGRRSVGHNGRQEITRGRAVGVGHSGRRRMPLRNALFHGHSRQHHGRRGRGHRRRGQGRHRTHVVGMSQGLPGHSRNGRFPHTDLHPFGQDRESLMSHHERMMQAVRAQENQRAFRGHRSRAQSRGQGHTGRNWLSTSAHRRVPAADAMRLSFTGLDAGHQGSRDSRRPGYFRDQGHARGGGGHGFRMGGHRGYVGHRGGPSL